VKITPLEAATADAWSALFERCGCACYCRYWHFAGSKNEWLARCVNEPERSREEHVAAAALGAPEAGGLVAMDGDDAVGWMKVVPRPTVPKLLRQGPYRAAFARANGDDHVWSIGCFLVDPRRRRSGVARALVLAAPAYVRAHGGTTVEAYPRRIDDDVDDAQAWTGTVRLFASCGFEEAGGDGPYPVMRRSAEARSGDDAAQPTTKPADSTRPPRTS
jgi:GNAT superfamily N-acetyltransferase